MRLWLLACVASMVASSAFAAQMARIELDGDEKTLVQREATTCQTGTTGVMRKEYPRDVVEHAPITGALIIEYCAASTELMDEVLRREGVALEVAPTEDAIDEVVTIVNSGPSENRIDLVFMGDGYTADERDKFFADMRRLVDDMFVGATFRSQLPLFNIHLVFRASDESGIGRNFPRDTAYRLYRQGNTLRAIYMQNRSAARSSCRSAPGCDYPVMIANDPYYGGLGGEFAISTSSPTSGTVVLRHELGHTIGLVGEEYDGGGYFGANFSPAATNPKWEHWLTPDEPTAEPIVAHHLAWPWKFLPDGPYTVQWDSQQDYSAYSIHFSASGIETNDAIKLALDGEELPFQAPGHLDRDFHDIMNYESGFGAGSHELVVSDGRDPGDHWLSSITVFEFGEGFHFEDGYVNNYPVFNRPGSVAGFRPTFAGCLMREMKHEFFCAPCQENNWLQMMSRISVIDELVLDSPAGIKVATVETLDLGQFRVDAQDDSFMKIRWSLDGEALPAFDDLTEVTFGPDQEGELTVEVEYITPEVRDDPQGYLKDTRSIQL